MKYLLLSCAFLCAGVSLSQSKRKQIEELQRQNDSLRTANEFLSAENSKLAKTIEYQEASIKSKLQTLKTLDKQRAELRDEITLLKKANYSLHNKVERLEPKGEPKEEQPMPVKPFPFPEKGMGGVGGPPSDFGDGIASSDIIRWNNSRVLLNNVDLKDFKIEKDAYISYRLTLDPKGRVVNYEFEKTRSNTSDQELIDSIGMEIKKQVMYEKSERQRLVYKRLEVFVQAN